ncbi:hypothetical protein M404DRAFT_66349, partial [Pisolithus tinctorius Marx 270]
SSTSSSSSSASKSSTGSSRSRGHRHRGRSKRRKSRGHRSHKSKKRSRSQHKTMLKPIPPTKYDGSDNPHAFHRFVTEGTAYVEDGHVETKKRAFILSHYLTGKAHEFYVHKVSGDPYKWRLSDFFMELFNYCFPIDFRMRQREKLQSCYQNSKTVRNYLYELNEIWNMIGETNEHTKVHKFWSGLRKELQCDLWKEKLNPEVSNLKKVVASVEILEIVQSITGDYAHRLRRWRSKKCTVESVAISTGDPESSRHRRHRTRKRRYKGEENSKDPVPAEPSKNRGRCTRHQDKQKRDNPKLSKDEQECHKAEGLCFICHKSGHFSRNCPDRRTVSSSGKPPGITSFGVDMDFGDVESQRHLARSTENDNEVSVNFIQTRGPSVQEDNDEPDDDFPDLESVSDDDEELLSGICYPGDDPDSLRTYMDTRFLIYDLKDGRHMIVESKRDMLSPEDRVMIENHLLTDPTFRIDRWYWIQKGKGLGLTMVEIQDDATFLVSDCHLGIQLELPSNRTMIPDFDVVHWHAKEVFRVCMTLVSHNPFEDDEIGISSLYDGHMPRSGEVHCDTERDIPCNAIRVKGSSARTEDRTTLQRNASITKDFMRKIPKPLVVVVHINGHPTRALIDTGSLADFMSITLAEQLRVKRVPLEKPLTIQLAVQGSRSKVNFGMKVRFQYQGIDCERHFDVMNLQNYDLILGTPFLYQHKVMVGLHSPRVVIGSVRPTEMRGKQVSTLESRATEIYYESIERAKKYLQELAKPLCSQVGATALPPFRVINHEIPLIDEKKIYPWRPSRCPEALRP